MGKQKRFTQEVRERAVRMLLECESEHPTRWSAMRSVAEKIGCSPETLRTWAKRAEIDAGKRPGMTSDELAELKALRRENKELKRANTILRQASAFFAQAELDRRHK